MIYKNFRLVVSFRILLLAATIFLFFYTLTLEYFITPFLIGVLIIFQIILLVRYVDTTNRNLASFLESIRFSEFSRSFHIEGMGDSFEELNKAFNEVIGDFQKIRQQLEEQYQYLQSIVRNIDISIITYHKDGTVDMMNKAFQNLFQVYNLKNIRQLEKVNQELADILMKLEPGKNYVLKIKQEDDILQLAVYGSEFRLHTKRIMLVTIKDIQYVLEEQETETWQKLIRVLTHEIMNSITPVASLTSTLSLMVKDTKEEHGGRLDEESTEEIQKALSTIHKRSEGLLHFVNTYRSLTKIPKPNFESIRAKELFNNIKPLMEKDLVNNNIRFVTTVDPDHLEFYADHKLIEQVLINLITNAIHALEDRRDGRIDMKAFRSKRGRPTITVTDNGRGILQDVLDKIFIPFFTTKPKGSGIGLSLSKQIMRLHGGSITAKSEPEEGTTFTLTF
ncbi:MAG: ATP-binding protein [Bacteroidales bacterium]|nr:ATP-binding protein [Bacteroidales bacterium]